MEKLIYGIFALIVVGLLIVVLIYLEKYTKATNQVTIVTDLKDQSVRELGVVRDNLSKEKADRQKFETDAATFKGTLEHERKQHEIDINAVNVALDERDAEIKELKRNSISLGVEGSQVDSLGFAVYSYLRATGMAHEAILIGKYFDNTFDWEDRYNTEHEALKASQAPANPTVIEDNIPKEMKALRGKAVITRTTAEGEIIKKPARKKAKDNTTK